MPRLKPVPRAEATGSVLRAYEKLFGDRDPVAQPGTATGTPGNWWTVFARVPYVFDHAVAHFGMFGMFSDTNVSNLDPKLREIGILRAAYTAGSQFVYSQHCKAGRRNGLDEQKIADIPHWTVSSAYTELERAILAYADCLILQHGRVPDPLFETLRRLASEEDILELTYHIMGYNTHAVMCRALKLEYDDVPERIVEVPVPKGGGLAADWAGSAWSGADKKD